MKILHIIDSLGRAGAEQMLLNILPELNSLNILNEVAVLFPPYDLQQSLESRGVRVHCLSLDRQRRWNVTLSAEKLRRLARRGNYDILHSHLLFANIYNAATRPTLSEPRRVATFHATDFDYFINSFNGYIIGRSLPSILRGGFDAATAVSQPVFQHYKQFVPGLKLQLIPNAFPLQIAPNGKFDVTQMRLELNIPADALVIAAVGRLDKPKGHEWLLRAMSELGKRRLFPHLILMGDGLLRDELEALASQLDLSDRVTFTGIVPHERIIALVQTADFFVQPSLQEGFGLAPAEAMLLEKPTITTHVGGLTDIIKHERTGLLVPPADAVAIADAIERLLNDVQLCERLKRNGRQYIVDQFGAPKIAAQWKKFYHNVL